MPTAIVEQSAWQMLKDALISDAEFDAIKAESQTVAWFSRRGHPLFSSRSF